MFCAGMRTNVGTKSNEDDSFAAVICRFLRAILEGITAFGFRHKMVPFAGCPVLLIAVFWCQVGGVEAHLLSTTYTALRVVEFLREAKQTIIYAAALSFAVVLEQPQA